MKLNDIVSQKLLKEFEPLMAYNPHMHNLNVVYAGEYIEDPDLDPSKGMLYQFEGTKRGFIVFCKLDESNKSLINKFDFHNIPERQKKINGVEYVLDINSFECTKMDDEFAQKLSKKYSLPYDVVLNCGNIESFYQRLVNGEINIDSQKVNNLIKDANLDDIIELFEAQDREILRSTLCDVNIDTDFVEFGEDIHPLIPLVEYIAKQQEVELSLPATYEEAEELSKKIYNDEPEL